jgi:hypothetical protein
MLAGSGTPLTFFRQLFLQLQEQLRSNKQENVALAQKRLLVLLRFLKLLESNTNRPLLAIDTALSFPSRGERSL